MCNTLQYQIPMTLLDLLDVVPGLYQKQCTRTCFATSLRKRIWGKSVEEPETLGQFPQPRQYQTQDELHIFADLCMTGEQYEQSITVQPLHFWHSEAS
jgi:hypothetical protein